MSVAWLIFREICNNKINFLLCLLVTAMATGIFIGLLRANEAAYRATANVMRDMGFNILIVPKGTAMARYWTLDFPDAEMPEAHVRKLSESEVPAEHFVAKLQKTTVLNGQTVVLTGVLPAMGHIGKMARKKKMGYDIPSGEAWAGSATAMGAALTLGGEVEVLGRQLRVTKVLPETGTLEDIRLFANLHDVQGMYNKPGRINAIDALGCRCKSKDDFLTEIQQEIEGLLPDTQVTHHKSIAIARELTRRRLEDWARYFFAAVLALGATALASLTYLNVRHRRHEIGLLRTVGVGTHRIAVLFLGKTLLYSSTGAMLGFGAGVLLAQALGPRLFDLPVEMDLRLLPSSLLAAPLLATVFGALPLIHGLTLDPAIVLREE